MPSGTAGVLSRCSDHSFVLPCLDKPLSDHFSAKVGSFAFDSNGGNWRLPRLVLAEATDELLSVSAPGAEHPMRMRPRRSRGSRVRKRTHLMVGKGCPCQPVVRSFPQSRRLLLQLTSTSFSGISPCDRAYAASLSVRLTVQLRPFSFQSVTTAPWGTSSRSRYFHSATSSFLAKATMPIRR